MRSSRPITPRRHAAALAATLGHALAIHDARQAAERMGDGRAFWLAVVAELEAMRPADGEREVA